MSVVELPDPALSSPLTPQIVTTATDSDVATPSQSPINSPLEAVGEAQFWDDQSTTRGSFCNSPVRKSPQTIPSSPPHLADLSTASEALPELDLSSTTKKLQLGGGDNARYARRCSLPASPHTELLAPKCNESSVSYPVSPQVHPADSSNASTPQPPRNPFGSSHSPAAQEWVHRKRQNEESSVVLDELMQYQGLEEVKQQFLNIKSMVDICKKQGGDIHGQRLNAVFQGNPGTGKTTVARLYARFLYEMDITKSSSVKETSGVKLATKGTRSTKAMLKKMLRNGGGVIFIDEAYQLIANYLEGYGRQVLDLVLTYIENNVGKLVAIFVGYKDEMEPFFEHNPGLSSRIPYVMNFADFSEGQLWNIMRSNIAKRYSSKMAVEGGIGGLYMRIVIRRLSQGRGSRSFGNARAVENLLDRLQQRQAERLMLEKHHVHNVDYLLFTKEDMIGPNPYEAAKRCPAWDKLQELIGLEQVKENVKRMIGMINANYQRELKEQKPFQFSLNCLFVGAPGTGKTTVAKLYGQILAHLGYLSRGDVIFKTPADFIGECLGKSEAKTKKILEASVGKILVIDEAYMLDAGDPHKDQDKFKTGVIDTMVSMIQGMPGEDRCIILVGYEDKLLEMFRNMNPGLSRRFPIDRPFRFNNFSLNQLSMIMRHEMREQDLTAAEGAMNAAEDVLERALMRPRFSNAGEVMAILNAAKMNYEKRQSELPDHQQTYDGVIEAVDIDPEFDRATRPDFNCSKMLGGRVHESIITKLTSYQKRCLGARRLGFNPREYVPTNFVFKGYPGTGKTTTAKSMGQIFYDMGFLSSTEVVECAATDLLGQYVGQTAPKTRKKLEEGLGHVILLDEAYRLRSGQYAAEAVDELVKFLTQPTNVGKMIVILAGNTADMDNLIRVRPELSSLFPEEIVFNNIPPADCITLLERELKLENIEADDDFLGNPFSDDYVKVTRLFRVLQLIPGWSNARDVKNLAKQIVGGFLESGCVMSCGVRTVSAELVINCMTECIAQKKGRLTLGYVPDSVLPPPSPRRCAEPHPGEAQEELAYTQRSSPPPKVSDICVPGMTGSPNAVCAPQGDVARATPFQSRNHANSPDAQDRNSLDVDVDRSNARNSYLHGHPHEDDNAGDQGANEAGHHSMVATEAMQASLRQGQKAEKARRLRQKSQLNSLERALEESYRQSPQVGTQGSRPGDDNPTTRDQLWNEMTILQRKIREQEQAQQALQKMGRCCGNFDWTKVLGGYLCSAAICYVTDDELHRFMR